MKNVPIFLNEKIKLKYGNMSDIIIKGLTTEKPVTFRVNRIKSSIEEIKNELYKNNINYKQVIWFKDAFILENIEKSKIEELKIYQEGKIYLQSLSSMIPPIVLNPKKNENILDMCSAPGGKTTQIASLSQNESFITAVEPNKIRVEKLKYNLNKQGAYKVNVINQDARYLDDYLKFDKILLDVPCSGSGTDNIFKSNFCENLIKKASKTQETLLKKALKLLKKGGELIYSTCSILEEENEGILEKVLNNSNFEIQKISISSEIPILPSKIKNAITICPDEYFEGFFITKIVHK